MHPYSSPYVAQYSSFHVCPSLHSQLTEGQCRALSVWGDFTCDIAGGVPKIRDAFLGSLLSLWGIYWGPLILGNPKNLRLKGLGRNEIEAMNSSYRGPCPKMAKCLHVFPGFLSGQKQKQPWPPFEL